MQLRRQEPIMRGEVLCCVQVFLVPGWGTCFAGVQFLTSHAPPNLVLLVGVNARSSICLLPSAISYGLLCGGKPLWCSALSRHGKLQWRKPSWCTLYDYTAVA